MILVGAVIDEAHKAAGIKTLCWHVTPWRVDHQALRDA